MIKALGTSSFGFSSFGYGEFDVSDPTLHVTASNLQLSDESKDYQLQNNSFERTSPGAHIMFQILATVKDSSGFIDFGNTISETKVFRKNTPAKIEALIMGYASAYKKLISVHSVTTSIQDGSCIINVDFTDLTTNTRLSQEKII